MSWCERSPVSARHPVRRPGGLFLFDLRAHVIGRSYRARRYDGSTKHWLYRKFGAPGGIRTPGNGLTQLDVAIVGIEAKEDPAVELPPSLEYRDQNPPESLIGAPRAA